MEFRKNKETREKFDKFINNVAIKYNVPIEALNDIKFQSVNNAGASVNENELAKKEWKEKGVESSYFKKWTGNANYVSVNDAKNYNFKTGEKVVVNAYHGTNQELNYFDYNKKGNSTNAKSAKMGFWFVDNKNTADSYADFASVEQPTNELQKELDKAEQKQDWNKFDKLTRRIEEIQFELLSKEPKDRGAKTYEVFIKFSNPYVFDANNNTFIDIQSEINNVIKAAEENGYDGVIIKNLKDKPIEGEYGGQTPDTHYLAFDNTQIKSVDNRGTFDANNPNIYYQSEISKAFNMVKDIFSSKDSIKADEIFNKNTILYPLKSYFSDVLKDTKIKVMPDWMTENKKYYGNYLDFAKTIYLNIDRIKKHKNSSQWFYRTLLHELIHAKQYRMLDYAKKNKNNKNLSLKERNELEKFIEYTGISNDDISKIETFRQKHSIEDIKNNKQLSQKFQELYNKYQNAYLEVDADNVALALQYYIGNANSKILQDYLGVVRSSENNKGTRRANGLLANIRAFNKRRENETSKGKNGFLRLSHLIDTDVYYQSAKESTETADNNDVLGNYLIAGYNLSEITDKLSELYENVNKADIEGNRELSDKFLTKAHILEDAIDVVVGDKKFNNANEKTDIALRAYYVMNNQEIPKSYEEADKKSLYYFTNLQAGCFYNKLFKVEVIMR